MHRALPRNRLALALSCALLTTASLGASVAHAQQQTTTDTSTTSTTSTTTTQTPPAKPEAAKAKTLTAVVVTGSLIRRVDMETASPVVTLDRTNILNSGKPTLGDVLQQLPSVSGNATNPSNNSNGGGGASPTLEGGDGASRVSLRGLGENRTLVLIDGQRMANPDLNMIPQSMIARVDVLAEGASTVYGSDAIGGVVNFILRKDYKGAEFSLNDGISSHGDGQRHGFNFTVGESGENGSIVAGLDYNKYDPVLTTKRNFSTSPLYLSSGKVNAAGSSSTPNGRIQVPANIANQYGCPIDSSGTSLVTKAQGTGSSLADYRCRTSDDTFNYNAYNYIQTKQEREDVFALGTYKLSDNVTFFADMFFNHTLSSGQDAPAPTGVGDGWSILASNPINPFGVTFSANTIPGDPNSGYAFNTRLTGLGTRLHTFTTDNAQINTGLRGNYGNDSSWTWDASVDYGHTDREQRDYNEVNVAAFQNAINSGVNIFDQADPTVSKALQAGVDTPIYTLDKTTKQFQFDSNGELWDMPAGAVQLSVGALYRQESMNYTVTSDAILDPATGTCEVLQEACGSPGSGSYNVKELYAETLIPLLSEQPWAHSLNIDLGVRSSDYSTSGTTTNGKIALEWRPIPDLLVRGTISQVFRAPDLDELYDGRTIGGPTLNDPCAGLSAAELAQHANACQFVPVNWAGNPNPQVTAYSSGATAVGASLKPEKGKSVDFGLVYDPQWAPGLSSSLDFWHIYLTDLLTQITAQTVANSCYANGDSPYCSYINRIGTNSQTPGQILYIATPVVNLGNLSTSGIDYTVTYQIPHFNMGSVDPGNFKVGLNTTYIATYNNDATPGQPGAETINYAGTYTQQFGNIARWRATATLNWVMGNWSAQWQTRYINHLTDLNADAVTLANAPMASATYHSIQLGYAVPSIHTTFDVGVDNLGNRIPPLIYQNGLNYNVDTATYDTLGRYYWARATVKF